MMRRLTRLIRLALLLTLPAGLGQAATPQPQPGDDPVIQRVMEIRARLLEAERMRDGTSEARIAQWYNWGNWPNWNNWGNWPNWNNWGNYWWNY